VVRGVLEGVDADPDALRSEESQALGSSYIGPEHVLLALAADEESEVASLLSRFGLSHTKLRGAVVRGVDAASGAAREAASAQRIVNDEVPETLADRKVLALDLSGLVAGTQYRGQFEERLKKVIDEIREHSEDQIVFVDELHTVVGASAAEGSMDASNMLKPALACGELRCIGATTVDEYRKK
jgi:ATP-dependent Clp protease ATP-binding subunit ClpA